VFVTVRFIIVTVSGVYVVCCTFFQVFEKPQPILFDFLTCSMNYLFIALKVFRVFTFEDHNLISSLIYLNYICVIYYRITACVSTSHGRSVHSNLIISVRNCI
jgi:hypothetical protein